MPKRKTDPSFPAARALPAAARVRYLHDGQLDAAAAKLVFEIKNTALLIENTERTNPFLPPVIRGYPYSEAVTHAAEIERKAYLEQLRATLDEARRRLAAAVARNDAPFLRAVAAVVEQDEALNERKKTATVQGVEFAYHDRNSADPTATRIARWHLARRDAGLPATCSDFIAYAEQIAGSPYQRLTLAKLKAARAALARTARAIGFPFDPEPKGTRQA